MGGGCWDSFKSDGDALDSAELVSGLIWVNFMGNKSTLGIIEETEIFFRLLNCDNI